MILIEVSKLLSLSLHYLDLNLIIDSDDLQIAFENCKQIELKKLLVKDGNRDSVVTTSRVIKDFVKEKNLEFLAYDSIYLLETYHENLKELAEEIQSFVKMVNYDDLVIRVFDDGNLT